MSFLDRMVADLIGDSTGLPVKGLVRKVGAKNLLLLGGMAAAGGYAAHKISQGRQQPPPAPPGAGQPGAQAAPGGQPTRPATVPPPPPPPPEASHAAPPPPPPPTPTATSAAPTPAEPLIPGDLLLAIVRTMVAAALCDGRMEPQERAAIQSRLSDSGLDQAGIAQVHQDLVIPAQPEELAALQADPAHRAAMLRSAVLILKADGDISDLERAWLDRLGAALGLDAVQQRELENDLLTLSAPVD